MCSRRPRSCARCGGGRGGLTAGAELAASWPPFWALIPGGPLSNTLASLPLPSHAWAALLPQVSFPLVFDALEFCAPALQAQLKGPRLAGKRGEPASRRRLQNRPPPAAAAGLFSASPQLGLLVSSLICPSRSPPFLPSRVTTGAAKEIEDRRVGLNKKQKLEEGSAAAAAGDAPAAGT